MKKDIKEIFSENLVKLMDSRGENLTDLSGAIDVSFSTVSDWRHGKKMARSGGLQKIAEHYNVNVSYLTTEHTLEKSNAVFLDSSNYPVVPASIPAGTIADIGSFTERDLDEAETITLPDSIMGRYADNPDIFITYVNGESMNNVIPDNSLIAVKEIDSAFDLENGDIIVFRNGSGMSVKRFYNDKLEQRLVFRPDSSDKSFIDMVVSYEDAEDVQIYGKVVVYVVNL